jgi:hypothetical protein
MLDNRNSQNIIVPMLDTRNSQNILVPMLDNRNSQNIIVPMLDNRNSQNIIVPISKFLCLTLCSSHNRTGGSVKVISSRDNDLCIGLRRPSCDRALCR